MASTNGDIHFYITKYFSFLSGVCDVLGSAQAEAIWVAGQVLGNVTTSPLLIRLNNVHLSHAILEVCIYIYV